MNINGLSDKEVDKIGYDNGFYDKYLILGFCWRDHYNDRHWINVTTFGEQPGGDTSIYIVPKEFKNSNEYKLLKSNEEKYLNYRRLEYNLSGGLSACSPSYLPSNLLNLLDEECGGYYADDPDGLKDQLVKTYMEKHKVDIEDINNTNYDILDKYYKRYVSPNDLARKIYESDSYFGWDELREFIIINYKKETN